MSLFTLSAYGARFKHLFLFIAVLVISHTAPGLVASPLAEESRSSQLSAASGVLLLPSPAPAVGGTIVAGESYLLGAGHARCTRFGRPTDDVVTLSYTISPNNPGIRAEFSKNPVHTFVDEYTFTAFTDSSLTPGTYKIVLSGTGSVCKYSSASFSLTVTAPPASPSVAILSEDITRDIININLQPATVSGDLKIIAIGDKKSQVILQRLSVSGGSYTFPYGVTKKPPLPKSKYSKLVAMWTVDGKTYSSTQVISFTVLVNYQHTQYNIPDEALCKKAKSTVTLWKATSECISRNGRYKSDFIAQTILNGTGSPDIGGYTHQEMFCVKAGGKPQFRQPFTIKTACGLGKVGLRDDTIAVNMDSIACGSRVLIVGNKPKGGLVGTIKTATDSCPACKTWPKGLDGHIDNFMTSASCSGTDLGNFQTILLGDEK